MSITHGMDAEAVRNLGRLLKDSAERIKSLASTIDGVVHQNMWAGVDAERFIGSDWPSYKAQLLDTANQLDGLGQSALNNVSEQLDASESTGSRSGASAGESGWFGAPGGGALGSQGLIWERGADGQWGPSATATGGHRFAGGANGTYEAEAWAGLRGSAGAQAGWDGGQMVATAAISGAIGAGASASGALEAGPASARGQADAFAGARAGADGTARLGLSGASLSAGAGAFAGAEASAEASAEVFGGEIGAGARAYAGIGAHAEIDASVTFEQVELGIDLGAAIGIGAGFEISASFSPQEALDDIRSLMPF